MSTQYNIKKRKKALEFNVNDRVSLQVLKIDRFGTDMSRLPCLVVARSGTRDIFYGLATQFGVLDTKFRAGDLMPYHGELISDNQKSISVREAHRRFCEREKSKDISRISCKCGGKCFQDKRCKCFSNNVKCSSHCTKHESKKCKNL